MIHNINITMDVGSFLITGFMRVILYTLESLQTINFCSNSFRAIRKKI